MILRGMSSQLPTKEELETRLATALAEVDGLREQLGSAQVEIRLLRAMHLPLCRQAQQMERDSGYAPSRSMLSDCVLEAGASLRLAKEAMKVELCTGGYIQADGTRVPVQVRTKEGVNLTGKF